MSHDGHMGDLLTTAEVAELRGLHIRTVQRMVKRGQLVPAQKLPGPNGAYLFDPEQFEEAS